MSPGEYIVHTSSALPPGKYPTSLTVEIFASTRLARSASTFSRPASCKQTSKTLVSSKSQAIPSRSTKSFTSLTCRASKDATCSATAGPWVLRLLAALEYGSGFRWPPGSLSIATHAVRLRAYLHTTYRCVRWRQSRPHGLLRSQSMGWHDLGVCSLRSDDVQSLRRNILHR